MNVTINLRILQITDSEAEREISRYYMRADVDGNLIRKQWVCAESLTRNFMKFQSRVEMARSYLRNFMRDKHGLEVDGEKQLIRPHINARIPGQTFRARDALHSSAHVRTCEISHVNCTQRASSRVRIRLSLRARRGDLIKLIIKKKKKDSRSP